MTSGFAVAEVSRYGATVKFAILDDREYIQSHHANGRFYEEDLLGALRDIVRPGDLALDIGANIGNHTVFLAGICGCRVVAVEPDPGNFAHLTRNVALNNLQDRVTLIHAAAGAVAGRFAEIASRVPDNSGATTVSLTDENTGIPLIRLDDLDLPGAPSLLKIDTEGMDLAVLQGASGLLARHSPVVVVEAQGVGEYDAIAAFLKQFGYVCLDARNPTPTFLFMKREVAPASAELVDQLAATFAHQRIAFSLETARLNERVREARRVYERSKGQLQASEKKLTEEIASLNAALKQREASLEEWQGKARKLSVDLGKASSEARRATAAYRAASTELSKTKSSASYHIGHAIVKAVTRPGKNTLLLPWYLLRLAARRLRKAASGQTIAPEMTAAPPVSDRSAAADPVVARWSQGRTASRTVSPGDVPPPDVEDVSQLRVACIMDEFTYSSYAPECRLLQLTPDNWEAEISAFEPHMLFVESAWGGAQGLWNRRISNASRELVELVAWCQEKSIPTVFWNKEDPVHFQTFIGTAKLFDHVFTTDIDCIARYRTVLDAQQVHLLLFACQPNLHNPLEVYERKDAFCFAGAYYVRYPERIADLETFVATLSDVGRLDIYDRNYHEDNPDYAFPEAYKPLIVGHLPPGDIGQAYKGYRYGVNLNSIKYSQTMFARRVYELLASNTITVSNYSRGLRLLFGDLVISTDNGMRLREELSRISGDELRFRKLRLAGLRKVLTEHTYRDRLAYVAENALGMPRRNTLPHVTVAALASDDDELAMIVRSFRRQRHPDKSLVLVLEEGYAPSTPPAGEEDVRTLTWTAAASQQLRDVAPGGFLAGIVACDYYGASYLQDLALATRYSKAPVIGKRSRYCQTSGAIEKQDGGSEYRMVDALPMRCAMTNTDHLGDRSLAEFLAELPTGQIAGECLSVDEFSYCQDYPGDPCPLVDDIELADSGLTLDELEAAADKIAADEDALSLGQLSGKEILRLLGAAAASGVEMRAVGNGLQLDANLVRHEYLYTRQLVRPGDLGFEGEAKLYFDITPGLDVRFVLLFLDARRHKLGSLVAVGNRNQHAPLPEGTAWLQIGLRLAGTGSCTINGLVLGGVHVGAGALLGRSDVLVVSNQYPQYDDLYRYAFLHRRLVEYRKSGQLVDVFRFNATRSGGYFEFNGIDVMSGYEDELNQALSSGHYRKVLVHFLDPPMWEVIRQHLDRTQVIVWLHGAEVQPWHRREYNFTTDEERRQAIEESDQRMAFWRGIFSDLLPNLHFVFVSQYFAEEVMGDVGIRLPDHTYSVIHNFIDTDLFAYEPKAPDLRSRILSIRPYSSRKYANDLATKAVLELSKEPFFSELEFRFIGDGRLFEETVEPLRGFPNVILERGFLRQEEIANLHREYGVLLTPTRMDAQGVSRDEAMSSGLVPVTNRVAAIPEFVDDQCGMLVDAEDYVGLAGAIARLYRDPELFLRLSKAAAERVRRQSARAQTIERELKFLGSA
jgi:FkbM family methyltransferase